MILTVNELIEQLQSVKNKDACVYLCVDGWEYAGIESVYDDTTDDNGDGCIGTISLGIEQDSSINNVLAESYTESEIEAYMDGVAQRFREANKQSNYKV